ncbi:MAG: hypothetical protein II544_07515 [Spirochaetales bacterium]|nr:hypothetical protein [Spirochaetales bacterium]
MFIIVHTETCAAIAGKIADRLEDTRLVPVSEALSDPEILGDFDNLGLVFEKDGKETPEPMRSFIKTVLGSYDLSSLEYMFSACVCDGSPAHALKIVEKLCSRVGCAPSLSITVSPNAGSEELDAIADRIKSGSIQLAKGSLGTMWYMKAHGIKR